MSNEDKKVLSSEMSKGKLTSVELKTIELINQNPEPLLVEKIEAAASYYLTTKSSLFRLAQKLQFHNYLEMRLYVQKEWTKQKFFLINQEKTFKSRLNNLKAYYLYAINETIDSLDQECFLKVCNVLNKAGRVLSFGIRSSFLAASDLAINLQRIRKQAFAYQDIHNSILEIASFKQNDVVIFFSESAVTKEILFLLTECVRLKIKTIIITSNPNPDKRFTYHLITKNISNKERLVAIFSKSAQIIVSDAIFRELYYLHESNDKYMEENYKILDNWKEYK
ncbi:MurR/RpiR family transcriptional regulator [[Mycoplasma] testudinis]|uniref:MurR/RpiR family transcriptional regulator n=1 Tax=[Mycoplasma] testudinis TaxID=33924 RepID=UPI000483783D|nr:MurR/RpiR family transcriptional regulator [[Mycoplasma] testudinis]